MIANTKIRKPWTPEDSIWLEKYERIAKGVYIKLVEYIGDKPFRPSELRRDSEFIKRLGPQDKLYREWCLEKGTGRFSMWSYETRFEKIFSRIYKMDLADYVNYQEDHTTYMCNRRLQLKIDEDQIKEIKKEIFADYL